MDNLFRSTAMLLKYGKKYISSNSP